VDVVKEAVPLTRLTLASDFVPSLNATMPVGVTLPVEDTVAVKVTLCR
jgi:hypothetical protein